MTVPASPLPDGVTILRVIHHGCEGEVLTEIAVRDGAVRRTGLCLGCGGVGTVGVVLPAA